MLALIQSTEKGMEIVRRENNHMDESRKDRFENPAKSLP